MPDEETQMGFVADEKTPNAKTPISKQNVKVRQNPLLTPKNPERFAVGAVVLNGLLAYVEPTAVGPRPDRTATAVGLVRVASPYPGSASQGCQIWRPLEVGVWSFFLRPA